jgi:hypothetical protein
MAGIRTALFLDFDNVYTAIAQHGIDAGDAFATNPARWLRWLESGDPATGAPNDPENPRRILIRNCYLNPRAYARYRTDFTRAAFRVVDCPPLTRQHKTGTDIHMVMDVLDALDHKTHFDEFILLSGDADFTPLLHRLRAHDRRTTVLSVGPTAAAYRSAVDVLVAEDDFLRAVLQREPEAPALEPSRHVDPRNLSDRLGAIASQEADVRIALARADRIDPEVIKTIALELEREARIAPVAARNLPGIYRRFQEFRESNDWLGSWGLRSLTQRLIAHVPSLTMVGDGDSWIIQFVERLELPGIDSTPGLPETPTLAEASTPHLDDPTSPEPAAPPGLPAQPGSPLRDLLAGALAELLSDASRPLHLVSLAQELQNRFGHTVIDSAWAGAGSFRAFVEDNLPHGALLDQLSATDWVLRDPDRHPHLDPERNAIPEPQIVERLCRVTGAPMLTPAQFVALFEAVSAWVAEHEYSLTDASRHVRDALSDQGANISRSAVSFILKGLALAGAHLEDTPRVIPPSELARIFRDQVKNLCDDAAMQLSHHELSVLDAWILGTPIDGGGDPALAI